MAQHDELKRFLEDWDLEARKTVRLLETLPENQHDFRPWPEGRSLGELAWHLADLEGRNSWRAERGDFGPQAQPPGIEPPRDVKGLAAGYQRVHDEAHARVKRLKNSDLDRSFRLSDGTTMTLRDILWKRVLQHLIHHRGQLMLMERLAGGTPPGMYGRTMEESEQARAAK